MKLLNGVLNFLYARDVVFYYVEKLMVLRIESEDYVVDRTLQ